MAARGSTRSVVLGLLALLIGIFGVTSAAAAPRCFGRRATIVGTGDRDRLRGTPRADVIVGLGKSDIIVGKAGNDLVCGGGGRDLIRGKTGDDRLNGNGGSDVLFGHNGNDELVGGGGGDALLDNPGNDRLLGGSGPELMVGGVGDDVFDGGSNPFDLVSFELSPLGVVVDLNVATPQNTNEGLDTLTGVEGLIGSRGNDVLTGQDLPTTTGNGLFGFEGTDQISGRSGDDVLDGEFGNDEGGPGVGFVDGGLGNDLVFGGFGDDDLFGAEGNDILDGFEEGETSGDFGSGGPDLDECFGLEMFDPPPPTGTCETAAGRFARPNLDGWRTARATAVGLAQRLVRGPAETP
jgi:Ca2+-binding RTX toxin-like protein